MKLHWRVYRLTAQWLNFLGLSAAAFWFCLFLTILWHGPEPLWGMRGLADCLALVSLALALCCLLSQWLLNKVIRNAAIKIWENSKQ